MKKLVVFGDSFANYCTGEEHDPLFSWTSNLADMLNRPLVNYGVAGSSLSYSVHKFIEYYTSSDFDSEDYIVFVISDAIGRAYTLSMPRPGLGVVLGARNNPHYTKEEKRWIKHNIKSLDWYQSHCKCLILNFDLVSTLSLLKVWTDKNKTNKLLALRAFAYPDIENPIESLNEIIKPTSNFYPIIDMKNTLFQISIDEFSQIDFFKNVIGGLDTRMNHLTKINREILSKISYNIFQTGDIALFDALNFVKHIYTSIEDAKRLRNIKGPV